MEQTIFDELTKNTGMKYSPHPIDEPHWELVFITYHKSGDFGISVQVADGFGALVKNSYGDNHEEFYFTGDDVQFHLGSGSYFRVPNEPPNCITVHHENLPTDQVFLGSSNEMGFEHVMWKLTFRKSNAGENNNSGLKESQVIEIVRRELSRAKIILGE